eukprot:6133320-Amphidinium_carterae.2
MAMARTSCGQTILFVPLQAAWGKLAFCTQDKTILNMNMEMNTMIIVNSKVHNANKHRRKPALHHKNIRKEHSSIQFPTQTPDKPFACGPICVSTCPEQNAEHVMQREMFLMLLGHVLTE